VKKKRSKNFEPVKHPGAATRKAKAEGVSLSKWEQEHKNDPGQTGKQARFPLIAKKWHHGGKKLKGRTLGKGKAKAKKAAKRTARKKA
jgi:hypothetical protein